MKEGLPFPFKLAQAPSCNKRARLPRVEIMLGRIASLFMLSAIRGAGAQHSKCPARLPERVDCGYANISQAVCEGRGCCWKDDDTEPACYHSVVDTDDYCLPDGAVCGLDDRTQCCPGSDCVRYVPAGQGIGHICAS